MLIGNSLPAQSLPFSTTQSDNQQSPPANDKNQLEDSQVLSQISQREDSLAEQKQLQTLKIRDREVRAHELAHVSAGGSHITSGASFSFETGSDGRPYAVAGEVSIDTSEVPGDPAATIQKSQQVIRAALAPAHPSAQDRRVASQAAVVVQQARLELVLQQQNSDATSMGINLDTFV